MSIDLMGEIVFWGIIFIILFYYSDDRTIGQ